MGEMDLDGFIIEWDDAKNEKNFRKHKIYFEDAAYIFLDDNRIDILDEAHSDDEERWKVIGRVRNILVVIYTERGENLRLISARKANKEEQEEYYGQYSDL
ncbi:MAG: BrnT family toxin [Selenomonadaceae bacterium]|nr:BrnT family toxin [Selenomonadaceae bacterium]